MQAMKELHLAEIGLISGGVTKKQVITGIAIGVGVLVVGGLYLTTGRDSQVINQVTETAANVVENVMDAEVEDLQLMRNNFLDGFSALAKANFIK